MKLRAISSEDRAAAPARLRPGRRRGAELHPGRRPPAPGPTLALPPGPPARARAGRASSSTAGPGQGPVTLTPDGERAPAVHAAGPGRRRGHRRRGPGALGHGPGPRSPSAPRPASSPARSPPPWSSSTPATPASTCRWSRRGSHQLVPQVASGEVDLALVVLPVTDPLVVTTPLFDDPLVLATAPDHPFAARRRVRVRDLDGLDLVMFREGYDLRVVTLAACLEAGVEPHLVSEGGEMAGVLVLRRRRASARPWCPPSRCRPTAPCVAIPFTAPDAGPHRRPGPTRRPRAGPPGARPGRPARSRHARATPRSVPA